MHRMLAALAAVVALAVATPARAAVASADAAGFHLHIEAVSAMTPLQAYRAFTRIGRWWSDSHTYSGSASNLRLAASPGGCWCETLPDGGFVRHMMVDYAAPGKAIRLSGGLGPLQSLGVAGALTVAFKAQDGGTLVVADYRVSGRAEGGWTAMAGAVDGVLTEQLARLAARTQP